MKNLALLLLLLIFTISCRENSEDNHDQDIVLEIKHTFHGESLELQTKDYLIEGNTTVNIHTLKYYLSNLEISKSDLQTYKEKDSYHLINGINEVNSIKLSNIPKNGYNSMSISIGVDSAHNHRADHLIPALSPSNGMAWSWKQGYKFFVLEGSYKKEDNTKGNFVFHIGTDPLYKTIKTSPINPDKKITLELKLEKVFEGIDISQHSHLREGEAAQKFMTQLVNKAIHISQ